MRAPLNGVLYNARTIKWCFNIMRAPLNGVLMVRAPLNGVSARGWPAEELRGRAASKKGSRSLPPAASDLDPRGDGPRRKELQGSAASKKGSCDLHAWAVPRWFFHVLYNARTIKWCFNGARTIKWCFYIMRAPLNGVCIMRAPLNGVFI